MDTQLFEKYIAVDFVKVCDENEDETCEIIFSLYDKDFTFESLDTKIRENIDELFYVGSYDYKSTYFRLYKRDTSDTDDYDPHAFLHMLSGKKYLHEMRMIYNKHIVNELCKDSEITISDFIKTLQEE